MHQDEGHYAAKHQGNSAPDEAVQAVLKEYINDERISCADAHKAASSAAVSPAEAGRNIDLIEVRISSCQLGLFGYRGREKAGYSLPADPDAISAEIKKHVSEGGISCLELWNAAEAAGCTRMEASAVCEERGIKISDCQLGAF